VRGECFFQAGVWEKVILCSSATRKEKQKGKKRGIVQIRVQKKVYRGQKKIKKMGRDSLQGENGTRKKATAIRLKKWAVWQQNQLTDKRELSLPPGGGQRDGFRLGSRSKKNVDLLQLRTGCGKLTKNTSRTTAKNLEWRFAATWAGKGQIKKRQLSNVVGCSH